MSNAICKFVAKQPMVAVGAIGALVVVDAGCLIISGIQIRKAKKVAESNNDKIRLVDEKLDKLFEKLSDNDPVEEVEATTIDEK